MSLPPRTANTRAGEVMQKGYSTIETKTSTTTLETLLRASREYGEDVLQAAPPRSPTPPTGKPVSRIGAVAKPEPVKVPMPTHEPPPWLKLGSPERERLAAAAPFVGGGGLAYFWLAVDG